ncbi:hypothetical protein [Rhizobium ruizarguesonis]|uniref:hypothetical protein n=1 Tax=Rhizobium ruizarguesonis TaxID=2081791 RepID=UPI001030B82B|nr:hypothetical protein [Rhizobium ruizarguesonis]TAT84812.1 hypothetical protein ELI52_15565 [Rhizobium ruizarguesonis]
MVDPEEPTIGNAQVRELEERVRELERDLESMTRRTEFLQEALLKMAKNRIPSRPIVLSEDPSSVDNHFKGPELLKVKSKPRAP